MAISKKRIKQERIDEEVLEDLESLADVIIRHQENLDEERDPFEVYVEHVKAQFHRDEKQFRQRFVEGYCSLIQEIQK